MHKNTNDVENVQGHEAAGDSAEGKDMNATIERPAAVAATNQPVAAPAGDSSLWILPQPGQEYPGQFLTRLLAGETLDFPTFMLTLADIEEGANSYAFINFFQNRPTDIVISQDLTPAERDRAIKYAVEIVESLQGFEPADHFYVNLYCSQPGRGISTLFFTFNGPIRSRPEIFDLKTAAAIVAAMGHPAPATED